MKNYILLSIFLISFNLQSKQQTIADIINQTTSTNPLIIWFEFPYLQLDEVRLIARANQILYINEQNNNNG